MRAGTLPGRRPGRPTGADPMTLAALLLLAGLGVGPSAMAQAGPGPERRPRPRVFVLTDIENEPDDAMSMVRFLTYSNQFDVEGLVATTSIHQRDKTAAWRIRRDRRGLRQGPGQPRTARAGFPDGRRTCCRVISEGWPAYGMQAVGEGKDSPGSEALIARGGPRRSASALGAGLGRPERAGAGAVEGAEDPAAGGAREVRGQAPRLHHLRPGRQRAVAAQDVPRPVLHHQPRRRRGRRLPPRTWSGISGDHFHGRFGGADFAIVDNPWLDRNVRRKGPLGAQYPRTEYLMEGDTPSFLYLIDNGLERPRAPGLGQLGRALRALHAAHAEVVPRAGDAPDLDRRGRRGPGARRPVAHDEQGDDLALALRVPERLRGAHGLDDQAATPRRITRPSPRLGHPDQLTAKPGDRVDLSAEGSSDPDGHALSYEWFCYLEPGTSPLQLAPGQPLKIRGFDQPGLVRRAHDPRHAAGTGTCTSSSR